MTRGFNRKESSLDESASVACRWTCPFCGKSRTATDDRLENARERATAGLRAHVYNSDGDGHGPRRAFPDEFEATSDHHTTELDD